MEGCYFPCILNHFKNVKKANCNPILINFVIIVFATNGKRVHTIHYLICTQYYATVDLYISNSNSWSMLLLQGASTRLEIRFSYKESGQSHLHHFLLLMVNSRDNGIRNILLMLMVA